MVGTKNLPMIWIVTGMGFTKRPPQKKLDMIPSLKLTAKAPEKEWLRDDPFILGPSAYFQVLLLLVSGRVFSSWFGGFHKTILQGGP